MKHGSLFSGIGGFDLAAEWMGWENAFHCEWNDFGKRVLKYYWPNAISYHDITKTDFTIHRGQIDILTGGFPCQPYSAAGKRKGTADNRHLWPEMLRAIREIQPGYIVGENVRGLTNWNGGLVFDQVQADLEAEGFEVTPFLLPACAVNAPHRRDRIWFVAHSIDNRHRAGREAQTGSHKLQGISGEAVDTWKFNRTNISWVAPDPEHRWAGRETTEREYGECEQQGSEIRSESVTGSQGGVASDTSNQGLQGDERYRKNENENSRRGASASGAISKLYRGTNWEQFPTQSPVCSRNDGLSSRLDGITFPKWRNESIKGYGNAIVPQVAYQIFKAIEQTTQP